MKVAKIFFKQPDYYIHGTPDTKSIGDAESHGCIRMTPWDVAALGRLMMKYGGKSKPESWFDAVIEGDRTEVIMLDEPVPMRVVD
jgi:murein L,D-transpeptidase YcbB/YkuD